MFCMTRRSILLMKWSVTSKYRNLLDSYWTEWLMLRLRVAEFERYSLKETKIKWLFLLWALVLDSGDFTWILCRTEKSDMLVLKFFLSLSFISFWSVSYVSEISASTLKISMISVWSCSEKQFTMTYILCKVETRKEELILSRSWRISVWSCSEKQFTMTYIFTFYVKLRQEKKSWFYPEVLLVHTLPCRQSY